MVIVREKCVIVSSHGAADTSPKTANTGLKVMVVSLIILGTGCRIGIDRCSCGGGESLAVSALAGTAGLCGCRRGQWNMRMMGKVGCMC